MNTSIQHPEPNGIVQPLGNSSRREAALSAWRSPSAPFVSVALFAGLLFLLLSAPAARADRNPPGCLGSGLGISLFTSLPDVHIGDTIYYSVNVFNAPFPACNAGETNAATAGAIYAFIVTPEGVTNNITLRRTFLAPGDSDVYTNVVSYVVRAQDIRPDGTIRATAIDQGDIHQNDVNSSGGGNQGVNTQVNLPCVLIAAQCVGSVGENGAITFTGTVTNCGNNTLVGVTVTNFNDNGYFTVLFPTNLAFGQVASFSGSWVPLNPCGPSTAILTVLATDQFTSTPRTLTNFTTITCQSTLTPGINVTKACPAQPVSPGQLLTYSGSVSNTGNVTLTNIVVVDSQPAANTPVFTLASLAPGAVANFTGSYTAPTNCFVSDTLTATASSRCGVGVSSIASVTCPILTRPQIAVAVLCPATPAVPGGTLTYSGNVRNLGDTTLTGIVVVSDRPAPNTTMFTFATLAPGESANFTSSVTVPAGSCSLTTTFSGVGKDNCTPNMVTNTVPITCPLSTAPAIAVTLACPAVPVAAGSVITYSGTVRNSGNITLNNVTVVNNQASPSTVFTVASLAPGVSANFTASFTAPADACIVSSTVTASGGDNCTENVVNSSASATCTLVTAPGLAVAQNCPASSASQGGLVTYSGSVSNAGNITLTNVVVSNTQSGSGTGGGGGGGGGSVSTAGLVGYWAFDEATGNVATDGSGLGNNGNIINATRVPGESGGALSFNGNAYVDLGNNASMNFNGAVTISAWINPQSIVAANDILSHGYSASPIQAVFMHIYQGRYEVGSQISDGAAFVAAAAVPAGDLGTFVHLAGVYDGSTWTLYRNGAAVATTPSGAMSTTVNANWAIGARGGGGSQLFNGVIDEVRLYQRALSATEIGLLAGQTTNPGPGPGTSTTVFTVAALASGAVANFTFSATVPTNSGCAIMSTLTGSGNDTCTGNPVTANVSSSCPLVTAPLITVTQTCPVNLVSAGGILTYSGTVSNAGNITLTNIVVTDNRPADNTVIFTAASLAPGASANFSGSYEVPINCCVVWSTAIASGQDTCVGTTVTDTDTTTCTVLTAPSIVVTKVCPPTAVQPGDVLHYSGTVSNAGNISLVDVTIVNSQPGDGSTVWGPITLAPGESVSYYASYVVPPDFCGTDTITARGLDACTLAPVVNSVTTTCPVLTTPRIAVTKNCPAQPTLRGGVFTFTGTVSNPGDVTLINVMVANNYQADCYLRTNGPVIGPITLAPGASVNFSGSYTAPLSCCEVIDTLTASGQDRCAGTRVMATATTLCPLLSTPSIAVVQNCPPNPIPMGSVYRFSGFVTNTGDTVLTNVIVFASQAGQNLPLLGSLDLAPGESAQYTGSVTVPFNTCAVTLTATSQETCAGTWITNTTSCPVATMPLLAVTQNCAANPVSPGGLLAYSGTVSNAGNITLNNILVINNQSGNTPLISVATLAPGASTNFTGSYLAPTNCFTTSTSTAAGRSICGVAVTNAVSTTCLITTTPQIVVTAICPATQVLPGGSLTFSGTVRNTGNITLTNIVVLNNQPAANTVVFTQATLASGASTNFTASYTVPSGSVCSVTSVVTANANGICSGNAVTSTTTATCPLTMAPRVAVTLNCPEVPATSGGLITYHGTVSNPGNVTLNNVTVVDSQSAPSTVLTVPSLAPGGSANFTASFTAPANTCSVSSTVAASGSDACVGTVVTGVASATCPLSTAPAIAVTLACPAVPVATGGLITYTGTVRNSGNVTLNNIVVVDSQSSPSTVLTVPSLAPGGSANFTASFTAPTDACSVSSTVTASGSDACTSIGVTARASTACPLTTTPLLAVTQNCPANPVSPGGLLTYSGTVSNAGNITLNNIMVTNSQSGNTLLLSVATLAPGASTTFTGSYIAPLTGPTTSTSTARATSLCNAPVTNTASSTCLIVGMPGIAVTKLCPPLPVSPGGTLVFTGTVTNTGNVTLTNVFVVDNQPAPNTPLLGPITLVPGASTNFTGSYPIPLNVCSLADTLTATGKDASTGIAISNTASANCALMTTPNITITESCPPGQVSEGSSVVFGGLVSNTGDITLTNIFVFSNQPSNNTSVLGPITLGLGDIRAVLGQLHRHGRFRPDDQHDHCDQQQWHHHDECCQRHYHEQRGHRHDELHGHRHDECRDTHVRDH
jgi:uncharacterized repeat protein (TIGR01451 family)